MSQEKIKQLKEKYEDQLWRLGVPSIQCGTGKKYTRITKPLKIYLEIIQDLEELLK